MSKVIDLSNIQFQSSIMRPVLNIGRVCRYIYLISPFLPAADTIWENRSPYRLQQKTTDI